MNCDPIASVYRWLEYAAFGRALERRRREFLPLLGGFRRALVLGDGDGRFLRWLLQINRSVQIEAVDVSAKMLELARRRAGVDGGRVCFRHADARQGDLAGEAYDLVVTHFFLDCFEQNEVERLVERVAGHSAANACWVVSEFRQPSHGWQALRAKAWLSLLYACFRFATGLKIRRVPDHRPAMRQQGFILEREHVADGGLLTSEFWRRTNVTMNR